MTTGDLRGALLALFLAANAPGCGGDSGEPSSAAPESDAVSGEPAPAAGDATDDPSAEASGRPAAFDEADLDAFERGFAREIELVRAAQQREREATTPEDRAKAAQDQWEDQTEPGGAEAAGMTPERYREVRETVTTVLETLDFQGAIAGPMELDLERAAPEMRARVEGDPFAELPPASGDALRARLDRLAVLWAEYVSLTAVAG